MGRRLAIALGACALLAGCGGDERQRSGDGAGGPRFDATEQQAADVATDYVRAMTEQDWEAACATRTTDEQRELARLGGTCDRSMKSAFGRMSFEMFEGLRPTAVRVRGDIAGVDLSHKGQSKPAITLAAVRDGERWRLEDVPDAKIP